jgi:hypothetical protein
VPAKAAKGAKVEQVQRVDVAKAELKPANVQAESGHVSGALAELSQPNSAGSLGFSRFSGFSSPSGLRPIDTVVPESWHQGVAHLLGRQPPDFYPVRAWRHLQDDAPTFLERWAVQAIRLGWQDWQIWGVHRRAPWRRLDAMGLVPMLRGKRILALVDDGAVIELRTGRRQPFTLRPVDPLAPVERRLIWDLE